MVKRIPLSLFVFLVLALSLASASGKGMGTAVDIGNAGDVFFSLDPDSSIAEISSPADASNFGPATGKIIWTGSKAPTTWLRFTLPGDGRPDQPNLLVVKPSFSIILDHIALYLPRGDGGFDELHSGAMEARREGELASRDFLFELPEMAFSGRPVYLRLSSATDVKVEVFLERGIDHAQSEAVDYIAYGILYGIILAMVAYGLFIVLTLKSKTYLYYLLYSLSAGFWLFFVQGHAKLIFGQHPGFDQSMLWMFAGGLITWGAVFTAEFLRLKEGNRLLNSLFLVLAGLGALASIAGLAGWEGLVFSLSHFLGLVLPLLAIAAAVVRIVQGYASALYFLIAWFLMAVGGILFSLMGLKIFPVSWLAVNGMAIGISAESLLFAIALADRLKRLEIESDRLESALVQYRELSMKDPLTGLYNKRYFTIKIEAAVKVASGGQAALSLLFMDLDDLKFINDSFGHDRGDEVLLALAGTLTKCVREGDEACRIGGDEFAVILSGMDKAGACRVAERIRSRFALNSFRETEKLNPTLSLGVSSYSSFDSPESLQKRADEALYEAKRLGKDRFAER